LPVGATGGRWVGEKRVICAMGADSPGGWKSGEEWGEGEAITGGGGGGGGLRRIPFGFGDVRITPTGGLGDAVLREGEALLTAGLTERRAFGFGFFFLIFFLGRLVGSARPALCNSPMWSVAISRRWARAATCACSCSLIPQIRRRLAVCASFGSGSTTGAVGWLERAGGRGGDRGDGGAGKVANVGDWPCRVQGGRGLPSAGQVTCPPGMGVGGSSINGYTCNGRHSVVLYDSGARGQRRVTDSGTGA